jgi:GntR family transcriptional regulator, transcriptional repressor for pyruvate dehydrogenase complex
MSKTQENPAGRPRYELRQPRVAEMIADILRERIIDGELVEDNLMLKEDDLLEEFQVARPSLREAMRILETEGLIAIRRGSRGGAVARVPTTEDAAYMLALVLRSRRVAYKDLAVALTFIEPACAKLCAVRPDRAEAVVPALRANIEESQAAINDGPQFTHLARLFHSHLTNRCGNETMTLMAGTLEALWSAREEEWAQSIDSVGEYPASTMRKEVITAHARIADAIERGDTEMAGQAAQRHLDKAQPYLLSDEEQLVSSNELRQGMRRR